MYPGAKRPQIALAATTVAFMAALVSCSSSDSTNTPGTVAPDASVAAAGTDRSPTDALSARLTTQITESHVDGWACRSDTGAFYAYTLQAPGSMLNADPSYQVGIEINPEQRVFDELLVYRWSVTSPTSALLSDSRQGISVDWTDIRFTGDDALRVQSSTRGALTCSRQSLPRRSDARARLGLGVQARDSADPVGTRLVPDKCRQRFEAAGAVPGTQSCFTTAISSAAGLGDYFCTSDDGETARGYCGLARYDENANDGQCPQAGLMPTAPGWFDFIFGPGFQFHSWLQWFPLLSAGANGYNLSAAAAQGQQTGDSSQFFATLANFLWFPLGGAEGPMGQIAQDFSEFSDTRPGVRDPCL